MWLQLLCLMCLLPAVAACVYYLVLAVVALVHRRRSAACAASAAHTFAILIPAHNEADILDDVLRSCADLDYPAERFAVFVIADNCTDQTAAIAQQASVTCLVRDEPMLRGKGPALAWALPQVLAAGHDAVVVLDADCRLEPHALRAFDQSLGRGQGVLQAKVVATNPGVSVTSYTAAIGNVLENDLFHAAKARLGWPVFLRGTGMVFARAILEAHPWQAQTIVEDTEYTLRLLRAGFRVELVEGVQVGSPFPADFRQLDSQRRRWTAGTFRFASRRAGRLMLEGLGTGRLALLDAGWTILIQVKPLLMLHLLLTLVLAAACCWWAPGAVSATLLGVGGALPLLYAVYVLLGILYLGVDAQRLRLLAQLPLVIAGMVVIFVKGVLLPRQDAWGTRSVAAVPKVEGEVSQV